MNRIEEMKHRPSLMWMALLITATVLFILVQSSTAKAQATNTFPASGNVGIGTTTPGDKLTVYGSNIKSIFGDSTTHTNLYSTYNTQSWNAMEIYTNGGIASHLVFTNNVTSGAIGGMTFANKAVGTEGVADLRLGGFFAYTDGATNKGYLNFWTMDAGTFAERMRITSGGNVGIGTTSPSYRLVVGPDISSGFSAATMTVSKGASTSTSIIVGASASNLMEFGWDQANARSFINTTNTTPLSFSQSGSVRMVIGSTGSVGIGTTSPAYLLDVAGQVHSGSGGFVFPDGTVQTTAAVSGGGGGGGTIIGVTAGAGMSGGGTTGTVTLTNADRGSSQAIFKNIGNAAGATQFSAGSNTDTLSFEGTGGTSVTFNAAARKVTINSSTSGSTITAANVSAGQFAQNTGGGDFTFPGNVTVTGNIAAKYQDVAEWVPALHALPAGTVVVLNPTRANQVMASGKSYDTRVAGVISAQPGLVLGVGAPDKALVATTGRVKVRVDARRAPIHIGDLLVTSDEEGMAMRSEPLDLGGTQVHRPGTLIGKALEPLESGTGEILVLLSLQ
jgi:hypothetical protein